MSFSELGLSEKVLEAVAAAGYTSPTPIQAQAIPPALARRDVLGIAQTGTGKTAAFTLPMLNRLETGRARARMPRTLILEPTRELAAQVEESFVKLGAHHKLSVALLIGGVSFADQDAKITRGVDVLIATPGRLLDHFERGKLLLTGIEVLVIDEADRMLDMGFIPDIERICKMVPFTRQTLFFSATMPPEIQRLTEAFLSNPVKVEVARPASTASTITQRLVASGSEAFAKRDVLRRLIRNAQDLQNAIIFCNRKRDVAILYRSLEKHGFNVVALHGDMDQRSRMQALDSFRNGAATLLVASDVAARGLDIPEVSHVFNFDVPFHPEDYVHRIGRTGRAGRSGYAASIVTTQDVKALAAIEQLTGAPIEWEGPTLDELLAENPDLDHVEPRRERERGRGARSEGRGRERRGTDRRGARTEDARGSGRSPREEPARQEAVRQEPVRQEPGRQVAVRQEAARREPVRHQPVRAGDRPVYGRARHDDELPVVGFGDHIPAFLLQKVVLGPPTDNLDVEEFEDAELVEVEDATPQEAAEDTRTREPGASRKRTRKKRTVDITTPADANTDSGRLIEAPAEAKPVAEAIAETVVSASAPEPVAPPEPVAETGSAAPAVASDESAAEEQPVKPARRTRKKPAAEAAPAPTAQTDADAPTEAAAKPRRTRTRKTAVEAEPASAAADVAGPEAVHEEHTAQAEAPKPKRTRRTKAASAPGAQPAEAEETPSKPARKPAARKPAARKKTTAAPADETVSAEKAADLPAEPAAGTAAAEPAVSPPARRSRKKPETAPGVAKPAESASPRSGGAAQDQPADDLSLAAAHASDS